MLFRIGRLDAEKHSAADWEAQTAGMFPTMADHEQHTAPHDSEADEPLGPLTPDDQSDAGDTPEVHDELTPHDLPKDHPGRADAVRQVGESGTLSGTE